MVMVVLSLLSVEEELRRGKVAELDDCLWLLVIGANGWNWVLY
jgi:hypothetical protein